MKIQTYLLGCPFGVGCDLWKEDCNKHKYFCGRQKEKLRQLDKRKKF